MARKTPIRLRRGPVSGRVQAVYRYTFAKDGRTLKAATDGKQDVHDDFESLALSWLMDDGAEDIVAILDGAADGDPLNDDERAQVRVVRERIREACEAHNTRTEASRAEPEPCGRVLIGQGTDVYDPCCGLPERHDGACRP